MNARIPNFENSNDRAPNFGLPPQDDELSRMVSEGCPNDVPGTYPADATPPTLNRPETWWQGPDPTDVFADDGNPHGPAQ
ncbi:MAG TPA: hypothetical protein VMU97_00765 [Candidatus Dormibacteraeota bacterium]|nr:hypothetical protein [Candidatus Dormibacteraeota bacterium]